MAEDCGHGFSDPAFCADCTPPAPKLESGPQHPYAIQANYRGRCTVCGDPIEVDDWIVPGSKLGWAHDECG